ncbi:metallophosphoesterase [Xanthovirga aplysinae]|uniref:metallophosphoesterase n=1 Tax=Xanthovirga aplysinae TaxID=2529853 RepID=UPI001656A018|nr:metallophosphoesterase [Xanthovirga aplysinae]
MQQLIDGPYISWESDRNGRLTYFQQDEERKSVDQFSKPFQTQEGYAELEGLGEDTRTFSVFRHHQAPANFIPKANRILAIGDLHGEYESLLRILRNLKVIDDHLSWQWGKGHIVVCGDVFDRGNGVTECLWLLYKLEQQAIHSGGGVHLLLGNHEQMILTGDVRYLSAKYDLLCAATNTFYSDLYEKHYVLGDWVRSRNVILKIGETLFVHAGISPLVAGMEVSIERINQILRDFWKGEGKAEDKYLLEVLMGPQGPMWYRGYWIDWEGDPTLSKVQLKEILELYNAKELVCGHTPVYEISLKHEGLLFGIDVPFGSPGVEEEVLLKENDQWMIYRVRTNERLPL